jgi:hypothetical protein
MPSKVFKRSKAAAPREVLCGSMPRTVRQNILDGARKWNGPILRQPRVQRIVNHTKNIPPRVGLKRVCLRMKA